MKKNEMGICSPWVLGVILISPIFLLGIMELDRKMLSRDEGFSWGMSRISYGEIPQHTRLDVHPPFYYWVLKSWKNLMGESIKSLRGLSLSLYCLSIFLIPFFSEKIKAIPNRMEGISHQIYAIIPMAFAGGLPIGWRMATYVRMYSLGLFLIVLETFLLVIAIGGERKWPFIFHGIIGGIAALTHNFLVVILASHYLIIFILFLREGHRKKFGIYGILSSLLGFIIIYGWWIPSIFSQSTSVGNEFWIPNPGIKFEAMKIISILSGCSTYEKWQKIAAVIYIGIALEGTVKSPGTVLPFTLPLFFTTIFVFLFHFGTGQSILQDRYFIFSQFLFFIGIGLSLKYIKSGMIRNLATLIIIVDLMAVPRIHNPSKTHCEIIIEAIEITRENRQNQPVIVPTVSDVAICRFYLEIARGFPEIVPSERLQIGKGHFTHQAIYKSEEMVRWEKIPKNEGIIWAIGKKGPEMQLGKNP